MPKKFQVFVSSTYTDLIDERQDTLKSILDLGHIPAGMEGFFAADEEQLEYIKHIIDECDYYIVIIAGRYGSLDDNGISYTEKEYDYAVSKGITILAFIHEDPSILPVGKVDSDPACIELLQSFKAKISAKRLVSYWRTRDQLRANVLVSLAKTTRDKPGIGWIRGDIAVSEDILLQYYNCQTEVDRLKEENATLKSQMTPDVDNLAELDETFRVRYTFYSENRRIPKEINMSWRAIFLIIGPSFFNPASQATITACLKEHISHNVGGRLSSLDIFDGDIDTIKLQMAAYNLMNIFSAQTVKGGLREFIQLTDFGKRILLELGTVKTSAPSA